ncbi:hypothetical protein OsI_03327 [Oryza sativa Indica Group]|uniref:Uncharacterized protein n=1 Tax=Oryza sativa subsp. indica TaxID=39946 RepID=A2WTX9_ORYSI|nr:hypothetical protein OsI_03327 [Oryza sativa Indica Group]
MAATADPRAKPPTAHHLKPWVPTPTPRSHRVPSLPAVSGGGGGGARAARDRRRSSSSSSHRRGGTTTDAGAVDEEEVVEAYDGGLEDLRAKLMGHIKDVDERLQLHHRSRSLGRRSPRRLRHGAAPTASASST